jgi:oligosaccharide repeat unit polymerase
MGIQDKRVYSSAKMSRALGTLLFFMLLVSFVFFLFGLYESDEALLLISVCAIWIFLVFKNLNRDRFTVLAFLITFFTFLMGTALLSSFDATVSLRVHRHETIVHIYKSLYIALLFLYLGTMLPTTIRFAVRRPLKHRESNVQYIQRASKYLFYISSVFSIIVALEKLFYVIVTGSYTSFYARFTTSLPPIVQKIDQMTNIAFFVYLATLPDPRKSKSVFFIRLLIAVIIVLFGQRSDIVMTIIVICIYCILYENLHGIPYAIIRRRWYIYALSIVPFMLVLLEFIMYYRDGKVYSFGNVYESIKNVFASLGGSVNVIGFGFERANGFPDGKLYSLGNVIDFLTKNVITRSIFGTPVYRSNSVEMALYGNQFAHAITYLVKPKAYLAGQGMGSSYIAEVFHDFGYIGIALVNVIYGVILTRANKLQKEDFVMNAIKIVSLYNILYAPRGPADSFISAYLNITFIATLFIIYGFSLILKRRIAN